MERDWAAERERRFAELDASYRAIGRYVVEFSFMVACMRVDIASRVSDIDSALVQLVLGEAPAKQVSDAFFGACVSVGDLDSEERKLVGKIHERIDKEITRRNDFAHGDWFMPLGPQDLENPASLVLTRTKPSRRTSPTSVTGFSSSDLDAATQRVVEARRWVLDIGDVCLSGRCRGTTGADSAITSRRTGGA